MTTNPSRHRETLKGGAVFDQYPKSRSPLSDDMRAIYTAHYKANRGGETPATAGARALEAWMHRQVAQDVVASPHEVRSSLELGAGTLNQLPYEPQVGAYDIVEPFEALYVDSPARFRVRHVWSDITEVPADVTYDRITSVAVLEHVCNLPEVVARCGLLLSPGGSLRAAIPSEGTPLWTMAYRLTTGVEFRLKYHLDYDELMRHEHVNTAREIEEVLRHFFASVECRWLGLAKGISFYQFYVCTEPSHGRCREYLQSPHS